MSYSIGHTLVEPLPDGRVRYTPCRHCGEDCHGHAVDTQEVSAGAWCRTCGEAFAVAQCDACRADGAALAQERSPCGHLLAEVEGREGGTRWCAGCEREARVQDEERAAVVEWLRSQAGIARVAMPKLHGDDVIRAASLAVTFDGIADAIERGEHRG